MNTTIRNLAFAAFLIGAVAPLTACKEDTPTATAIAPASAAVAPPPARVVYRAPVAPRCQDCGTIAAIEAVKQKGKTNGTGAVLGAVAGAVIGHQFGGGKGKDVATAGGAVAGGVAGYEIEKNMKSTMLYHVTVSMNDGGTRTVDVPQLNGLAVGSKVKVIGNSLEFASR